MDVISIIATVATVALTIWFTVVWIREGFKKSILYLFLSLAVLLLAFYFKTKGSEMISRYIIACPAFFMAAGGIYYMIVVKSTTERTNGLKVIAVSVALFLMLGLFGMSIRSSSSSYDNDNYYDDYDNDNYYDDYDYDNDGNINQNEWEDALDDYMDDIMD